MEMPNVTPPTTTLQALRRNFDVPRILRWRTTVYFGATNDNLDELKALTASQACGVKVFMETLPEICWWTMNRCWKVFRQRTCLVATHASIPDNKA